MKKCKKFIKIKRNLLSLILLTFLLFFPSKLLPASDQKTINQAIEAYPEAEFKQADNGIIIRIEGFDVIADPGNPILPGKNFMIAIPKDADISSVNVSLVGSKTQIIENKYDIAPAPPSAAYVNGKKFIDWGINKNIIDGRNTLVYEKDGYFPDSSVKLSNTGKIRDWKVINVTYYPFKYNPVKKLLVESRGGEIVISYNEESRPSGAVNVAAMGGVMMKGVVSQKARQVKSRLLNGFKSKIKNIKEAEEWYGGDETSGPGSGLTVSAASGSVTSNRDLSADAPGDTGYYILTTQYIANNSLELNEFVNYKTSLGFNVKIITEADWGGGTGNTAAERIRTYLQNNYESDNVEYVLLIGNPDPFKGSVPMKMTWPRYHEEDYADYREAPTDYYYADLNGDWDLDNDGIYAEAWDDLGYGGVDVFPEVIVGRIPYYGNINDLDSILYKLVSYENGVYDGPWSGKVLLSMKPADEETPEYPLGEAIKNEIISTAPGFFAIRVYDEDYGLTPPPEYTPCNYTNVLDAWQENVGFHIWSTHGSPKDAVDVMKSGYCKYLADDHPSFVFSSSCNNGYPDINDNLGYSLLKNGAVSVISASRVSWYSPGETDFHSTTNDGMAFRYTQKIIKDFIPSGYALFMVKAELPIYSSSRWMNQLVYNLYGDPSMTYYVPGPAVSIISPEDNSVGLKDVILKYMTNLDGGVTVTDSGTSHDLGFVEAGSHTFTLNNLSIGYHTITVRLDHNGEVAEDTVQYKAAEPVSSRIEGFVYTMEDSIQGAEIRVENNATGALVETVKTDSIGYFQTSVLSPGEYRLTPGYAHHVFTPPFDVVLIQTSIPDPVFFLGEKVAEIFEPAPDSTISASDVTFRWSPGENVSEYFLGVGTTKGSLANSPYGDIYNGNTGQSLSAEVAGIPLTGKQVYARLWIKVNGSWDYEDYVYVTEEEAPQCGDGICNGDETCGTCARDCGICAAPAEMETPVPGSEITGSSVTFRWSAGARVSQYWLSVGTDNKARDIYHKSAGKNTSVTVNGIPLDGGTLYVILWSKIDGSWQHEDYTYMTRESAPVCGDGICNGAETCGICETDCGKCDGPAEMETPVPGSEITGSSVTFRWSAGARVSQYWLSVGTDNKARDIYHKSAGKNTSVTVNGIPLDGGTLYVILWSKIDGSWLHEDYTYTTRESAPVCGDGICNGDETCGTCARDCGECAAPAEMVSPAPGEIINSESVMFIWSTGANVSEYWLGAGTSKTAKDLFYSSTGTETFAGVYGIPLDGKTLYVKLWSKINGTWHLNEYIYLIQEPVPVCGDGYCGSTEGCGGCPADCGYCPAPAELVSPEPGAFLTGPTVTFTWSDGVGVSEYWLQVGTNSKAKDIFSRSVKAGTSAEVTGIPQDGGKIYVKLWSKIDGEWTVNDYTFDTLPFIYDPSKCGDGACDDTEFCFTCPEDCGYCVVPME